ncbi:oligosaccharide flippase family protein [Macrococcus lamae]|uniref:Polysaccharide biosynthesis protein C-terminal domain-containing protein n=1 Tax=Macrococcus lamae TaxID=198484 RepID=A0A4R6BSS1_9STAP|nr:oligosaccharide flippase family protein [Macrococcus lamae]TDM05188.1 hypothetical protein ERX29_10515 [Macrococcus lamae]
MIKNISQLFISNFIFGLSQLLIIICLNKFGNVVDVGNYTLGLAIVAPITVFLNMSLNLHYNTNKEETNFNDYFILRLMSSSLIIVISLIVGKILNYESYTLIIILLLASLKFIESVFEIDYAYFQKKEEHYRIAYSKTIRSVFLILWIFVVAIFFKANLVLLIAGIIISNFILFFLYDFRKLSFNVDRPKISFSKIRLIILTALPLAISSTFDSLNINAQRILIDKILSIEELGIYASIMTIMVSGQIFIAAVMTYFLPKLNFYISNKMYSAFKKTLRTIVIVASVIGLILIIGTYFFGESILTLVYTKKYEGYDSLALLIMIAGMFWYISGSLYYCLLSLNLYKTQMVVILISFIIMIVSTMVLVEKLGLEGAALSIIFSMVFRVIGFAVSIFLRLKKLNKSL